MGSYKIDLLRNILFQCEDFPKYGNRFSPMCICI